MSDLSEFQRTNQEFWDHLADVHAAQTSGSDGYRIEEFLKGGCILDPLVRSEIGNMNDLSLLHFQCHFGLDTLSLARLGATVTGIDFSHKAISAARKLSEQSGVAGRFIEGRIEDIPDLINEQFDRVFTSWGAINWLDDLSAWASSIDHALKPGGVFYIADAHPMLLTLDDEAETGDQPPRIRYDYFHNSQPIGFNSTHDYADEKVSLKTTRTFQWFHSLGEILTVLCDAGLRIDFLHEHDILTWRGVKGLIEQDKYFHRLPDRWPKIPLSFSIRAIKPRS